MSETERDEALRLAMEAQEDSPAMLSLEQLENMHHFSDRELESLISLARSRPGWKWVPERGSASMLRALREVVPCSLEEGKYAVIAVLAAAPSPGDAHD